MARCHACLFSTPGGEPLWIVSRHPRKFRLNANPAETFRKQAAPANHRTRYLVPSHRSGILDPISAPVNLTPVETFLGAARLTRYFGLPRSEKNITRSSGALQSGSPAMGIVKLLRVSELGFHFVRATKSRRKGVGVERLIFGTSCLGYTVGLPASERPTCYPCPAGVYFKPAHIVLNTSTSRQASAPNFRAGVCPGEPTGARRSPKPF